ncbi:hypothetical protein N035_007560 [Klebsiella pneumoniae EGD-HP19-C]|nr:hypothetical protein N035_007560 [Klebsiella pneumoniae EGD-HP19-C]
MLLTSQRSPTLNVTITRFRGVRYYSKRNKMIFKCILFCNTYCFMKNTKIVNDVVRSQDQHQRITTVLRGL